MSAAGKTIGSQIAEKRLLSERKGWRKDHPFGFWVRPKKDNMFVWQAGIPGKQGTIWEGGEYVLEMKFPSDYPQKPPSVKFIPPLFHPNVFTDGRVCLSILNEEKDWKPSINIKQILLGVQELLDTPNPFSPAQSEAYKLFVADKESYIKRVKEQAKAMAPK